VLVGGLALAVAIALPRSGAQARGQGFKDDQNYAMRNILSGARAAERAASEASSGR
jgi:hypothetical protein